MIIREAVQDDNPKLIELQKKCPMGSDMKLQMDSSPDFFNRSKGYEDWNVLVAEEEGIILGSAGYAVQHKPIGDETYSMVYEYGFMVDPEARRKGVASSLQIEIEKRVSDADYLHLNITEDNIASHSFFKGHGFKPVKKCAPFMVMAYKEHKVENLKIRKMRDGDIPVVIELLNETYRDYELYEPFTESSFRENYGKLPFYSLDNIYLFEQDTVLAVAGIWDYDKVMKFTLLEFNNRWKMMRLMTKIMGLFTAMPKMPGAGEQMSNWYLTPLGYRAPESANQLIGYLLNLAKKQGVGMISLPIDVDSPIKEVLSGYRYSEGSFTWYMKSVSGKKLPEMGTRPLYVDVKDV